MMLTCLFAIVVIVTGYLVWRLIKSKDDNMPDYLEEDSKNGWSGFFDE